MTQQRNFNYASAQNSIEQRNQAQASRVFQGIPGISRLTIKENELRVVRFLTPFSLGLDTIIHTVMYAKDNIQTYVCERNYSDDPNVFCPVCQFEHENEGQKISNSRVVKNFLVYDYSLAGKVYEATDGSQKAHNTVNVLAVGPGKDRVYWKQLEQIAQLFYLSGVDVEIMRTGKGLQTTYSYKARPVATPPATPGAPITQSGSQFNWDLIPQEIKSLFPPYIQEPGQFDPFNPETLDTLNKWGDFYIKAQGYKQASEFKTPNVSNIDTSQPPVQGQPTYQTQPMTGQPINSPQTGIQQGVNPWR